MSASLPSIAWPLRTSLQIYMVYSLSPSSLLFFPPYASFLSPIFLSYNLAPLATPCLSSPHKSGRWVDTAPPGLGSGNHRYPPSSLSHLSLYFPFPPSPYQCLGYGVHSLDCRAPPNTSIVVLHTPHSPLPTPHSPPLLPTPFIIFLSSFLY